MTLPVFFPPPVYVRQIRNRSRARPLDELCRMAGVECQALGDWVKRPVVIRPGGKSLQTNAEPGDWGAVEITLPENVRSEQEQARLALGALAYSLFDGVARASIAGQEWSRAATPRGRRPGVARARTNSERQRDYRSRHAV